MNNHIEFRNETEEDYNVMVCKTVTGNLYVHLLGDEDEFHGDEATTVPAEYYEIVAVNEKQV